MVGSVGSGMGVTRHCSPHHDRPSNAITPPGWGRRLGVLWSPVAEPTTQTNRFALNSNSLLVDQNGRQPSWFVSILGSQLVPRAPERDFRAALF